MSDNVERVVRVEYHQGRIEQESFKTNSKKGNFSTNKSYLRKILRKGILVPTIKGISVPAIQHKRKK